MASASKAKFLAGYFKTGPGEYGEGDTFLGVTVPEQRRIAKRFAAMPFPEYERMLASHIHEHRVSALIALVHLYEVASLPEQKKIVDFYLAHTKRINNWDLVDASASYILGAYLFENKKSRAILRKLAHSKDLWERRIAIVATHYFIRRGDFADTLTISELLLRDTHDLIYKAVGWMLREVGNRDRATLEQFLEVHAHVMPRTMLRYAIEKFPQSKRSYYLGLRALKIKKDRS